LTLLYSRERGDGSGCIEVAISECAEYFAQPLRYGMTGPGAKFAGIFSRYNLYETRQGWIAIAPLEAHFWERFREALGISGDEPGYGELQEVFLTRSAAEWEAFAASLDLPIAAVR
jgi:crotonobetainyl-CoA:carnitine CoA-transferase CaiB-like acyl-CoA transferase